MVSYHVLGRMLINGMCVKGLGTLREGSIAPQNTEILWKCLGFHRMLPETAQIQEYPVKHFLLLATCLPQGPGTQIWSAAGEIFEN